MTKAERIYVRLTTRDKDMLYNYANKHDMTISELMRTAALSVVLGKSIEEIKKEEN